MERSGLSSKIVLISAESPNLVNGLTNVLHGESCKIFTAANLQDSVAKAIMVEPDFILIEVTPVNFSGLQIPETLRHIHGFNKTPYVFIMAEKKFRNSFMQRIDPVHFLGDGEFLNFLTKMKAVLPLSPVRGENPFTPVMAPGEPLEPGQNQAAERDFLDKLDQLGIIRKK